MVLNTVGMKTVQGRVLAAATSVFRAKGYAEASLAQIAAHAGLTKGAIYSNFDTKLDLALAVLDQQAWEPRCPLSSAAPHNR